METVSHRLPLGVCAGIFAFNFPAMLPLWGFPLACALGNTYLLKPSERVPSAGLALAGLANEAGLPPGVLNVVHGGPDTVNFLCSPATPTAAVSFVGSNPGGEHVFSAASAAGKRVQSNMGAKNHGVLMGDADLSSAAPQLVGAAFGAAGQRCMALPVVILVGEARGKAPALLVELAKALKVGAGVDPAADLGPMISAQAVERARRIVGKSLEGGARLLLDGRSVKPPQGCEGGFWMGFVPSSPARARRAYRICLPPFFLLTKTTTTTTTTRFFFYPRTHTHTHVPTPCPQTHYFTPGGGCRGREECGVPRGNLWARDGTHGG